MRSVLLTIAICLCWNLSFAEEGSESTLDCGDYDASDMTQALPVIMVRPEILRFDSDSPDKRCIVVAFGLKRESRGMLQAYQPTVVAHDEGVSDEHIAAAEAALLEWRFLRRSYDASDEPIYYSEFSFTVEPAANQ